MNREEIIKRLGYGKNVKFSVYGSRILGDIYQNCKVVAGGMDMESAAETGRINPPETHLSVYPTIPPENNVSADANDLMYIKLRLANGEMSIIAVEWIIGSSIQDSGVLTATVKSVGVTLEDHTRILEMYQANGFPTPEIEIK